MSTPIAAIKEEAPIFEGRADSTSSGARSSIIEGDHMIGSFTGNPTGPTLIVTGGLHGNEPSGMLALRRVSKKLEKFAPQLRGRVAFLAGNTRALKKGIRFIDSDLNRHWTYENLEKRAIILSEDREMRELLETLDVVLATAKDEVFAIDLHSTSANGLPFATVGDTIRNRGFARKFPVTILLGIEEQLDGTLLEYLNNKGVITFGFEGGQHDLPSTIDNHEALVWVALVNAGILKEADVFDLGRYKEKLRNVTGVQRIIEVRYRQGLTEGDGFQMKPGFLNFDLVRRGDVLAENRFGTIASPETGLILMPLYQKLGEDGFFITRLVAPFWLSLSSVLRGLKLNRLVRFLPGVRKDPDDPESLIVDTRVARFFPLQVFHLLGFRKRRWRDDHLIVSRRRFDTVGPFRT
ncbi:MAG: succinylglutamate desuccinylase/aspartoacylase family protein [Pyrinomonadaceae bacterium]